jgi:mannobiose 2-epimerase
MKMEILQTESLSLDRYAKEVSVELQNILSYWFSYTYNETQNNFFNKVDKDNIPDANSPKGIVLNSRILWTFAAASRLLVEKAPITEYLTMAETAYQYLVTYFKDKELGGVYWSVDAVGKPLDKTKQMYGHSFALYAFSEYYKIMRKPEVLNEAIAVYQAIENHAFDKENLGYVDAFEQNWQPTTQLHLSKDGAKKTMNTHLHLLEAYTNLYRVWKDEGLKKQLYNLIDNFLNHIIDPVTHHLISFFQENWKPTSQIDSYGHDIECSWLLLEAGEVLEDEELIKKIKPICVQMAMAAAMGLEKDGGMRYEFDRATGHQNNEKSWWVQAEAMVGFFNAWQISGAKHFLDKSLDVWKFIKKNLIDKEKGEWFMSANNKKADKVTLWKCPYHNARACIEIFARINR